MVNVKDFYLARLMPEVEQFIQDLEVVGGEYLVVPDPISDVGVINVEATAQAVEVETGSARLNDFIQGSHEIREKIQLIPKDWWEQRDNADRLNIFLAIADSKNGWTTKGSLVRSMKFTRDHIAFLEGCLRWLEEKDLICVADDGVISVTAKGFAEFRQIERALAE